MSPTGSAPGQGASPPRRRAVWRTPTFVLEALRLLVVVFFAGAGYQIGSSVDTSTKVLGTLNGTAVGLIIGSGLGYVLGGILGRTTGSSAQSARTRRLETAAEQ